MMDKCYMLDKITERVKTPFIFLSLVLLLFSSSIFTRPACAEPDWQVTLTVKSGTAYNRLVLGADSSATNGYDPQWDTYALMGGTVQAYFSHPEWGLTHQEFHRDIRAHNPGAAIELPLTLNSTLTNADFTISWDISFLPQDNPIILIDDTAGQQVDMRTVGSYNFTYTGMRSFRINITENTECSHLPVRIARGAPAYFPSLQDAYNAATDGEMIESRAASLTGNLDLNMNKTVSFTGGYNCGYSAGNGTTTLNGTLTISSGTVTIENVIVQ